MRLAFLLLASTLLLLACGEDRAEPIANPSSSSSGAGGSPECGPSSGAIELDTGTGTLHGTVTLPEGCGPFPTVLMHVGSGPTDRDGNQTGIVNDSLKLLAEALASRGLASVRYDKRGIAQSAPAGLPSQADYRFHHFVDDLEGWLAELDGDERFGRLTVAGHSEGSLIAILASQAAPTDALVSLAGPGRPAGDVLREQLAAQLSGTLLDEANAIIDALEAGQTVDQVPSELLGIFHPSVQPYLISWFQYDPAEALAQLSGPVQIIQGTTDIQVQVADAELLAAAYPTAELHIIENMCHVLKEATLDSTAQNQAYTDPSLPIMAELVDALAPFALGDTP